MRMNEPAAVSHPPARSLPRLNPFEPPVWLRWSCVAGFVAIALYLGVIGGSRIHLRWPDFEYFYKAGAWLQARGDLDPGYDVLPDGAWVERGKLDWYWPFVPRMMTLLTWMPYKVAGYTWLALNLGAMFATLWLIGRYLLGMPGRNWPVTLLLPFVLLLVFWYWEFRLNQVNNFTLLMLVGSFVAWQRGRPVLAGGMLGWAVLLKVTPLLIVVWFGLKRQYRTLAAALAFVALAGPVSDVIVFGPERAKDIYLGWAHAAVVEGSHRGLILSQKEMDWRNQAIGAVLCRWLHPTSYAMRFDNEPRAPRENATLTHNVAELPLPTVAAITMAVAAASGLGLLWLARRPAWALTVWQLRLEWGLFLLAMLWFMPVLRLYHMIWAFPALALVLAAMWHLRDGRVWRRLALGCIALVLAGQAVLPWRLYKSMGATTAAVPLLAVPVVTLLVRLGRRPEALPPDRYATGNPLRRALATPPDSSAVAGPVVAHA